MSGKLLSGLSVINYPHSTKHICLSYFTFPLNSHFTPTDVILHFLFLQAFTNGILSTSFPYPDPNLKTNECYRNAIASRTSVSKRTQLRNEAFIKRHLLLSQIYLTSSFLMKLFVNLQINSTWKGRKLQINSFKIPNHGHQLSLVKICF